MGEQLSRRRFVRAAGAAGAALAAGAPARGAAASPRTIEVVNTDEMLHWIRTICEFGVRRPGYTAGAMTEQWCAEQFRALGLERVRLEPFEVRRWVARSWSLVVTPAGGVPIELDCYPVPYSAPTDGLELTLAGYAADDPAAVAGRASLHELSLTAVPAEALLVLGSIPTDVPVAARSVDLRRTLADVQVMPTGAEGAEVMQPSIDAGALAFVGTMENQPGDTCNRYLPYDGIDRPIPGVWIRPSDARRLRLLLAAGPVRVRLEIDSEVAAGVSHNVVGELPGADDEAVHIASHHDAPWASATEDATGIALILAQAAFWAQMRPDDRPHRLVFVLRGGHFSGSWSTFVDDHRDELASVVLSLHLEHAALEVETADGDPHGPLRVVDRPVPRWWFTSRNPALEATVIEALRAERLDRSMVLAPDAVGPNPPSDAAAAHERGVPVVSFLAAPPYLFDRTDTIDKVDRNGLVPLTNAAISIIAGTAGVSAAEMRAGIAAPTARHPGD